MHKKALLVHNLFLKVKVLELFKLDWSVIPELNKYIFSITDLFAVEKYISE